MVDQDEDGGLGLAVYAPHDIAARGNVSSGIVASFVYGDGPAMATHGQTLGASAHMAALDPKAVKTLAALLETTASYLDRAEELGATETAALSLCR